MIKKLDSKIVYHNKWLTVTEDQVEFANGYQGIYSVLHKPPCGLAIPYQKGKVTLVKVYRYPIQQYGWEFPMGAHEEDPNMKPEDVAITELKEETGLVALKAEFLGKYYFANGFATQPFFCYLMTNLTQEETSSEVTEQLEVKTFSLGQVEQMVLEGSIVDSPTVTAMYVLKLKKPELFESY